MGKGKVVIASIGVVSVGVAIAYFGLGSSSSPRKTKRSKTLKLSKYKKSFEKHPFGVVWACDEEQVGLYVAADQKNIDLSLKIGSMLVKIGDQRVAGETMQKLTETLRRVKDSQFPIELQFLEQPKLEEAWTNSQTHRSNGKELFKQQKFAEALLEYDEAIKLHPTLKLLHSNKVLCLLKLQQYEMALQSSHEMLKLDPYYPKGHYLKGCCHLEVGKKLEKSDEKALAFSHAVAELRSCLRKQPDNQAALGKLKESQLFLKKTKEQIKEEVEKEVQERKEARERLRAKSAEFMNMVNAGADNVAAEEKAETSEVNAGADNVATEEKAEASEVDSQGVATEVAKIEEKVASERETEASQVESQPSTAEVVKVEENVASEEKSEEKSEASEIQSQNVPTEVVKTEESAATEKIEASPEKQENQEPIPQAVTEVESAEPAKDLIERAEESVGSNEQQKSVNTENNVEEASIPTISTDPSDMKQKSSSNGEYVMVTPRSGESSEKKEVENDDLSPLLSNDQSVEEAI